MRLFSVLPSVSILRSTGMRNRSRSCEISPVTRKPGVFSSFGFCAAGSAQAVGGVLHLEFRRAGGVEPLREEPGELVAIIFLGDRRGSRRWWRIFPRTRRRTRAWSCCTCPRPEPSAACAGSSRPCRWQATETRWRKYRACWRSKAAPCHRPARPPTYLSPLLPIRPLRRRSPRTSLRNSARSRRSATSHLWSRD